MGETISEDSRKCAELMCRCCTRLCRVMNGILARTGGVNMAQCQAMSVLSEIVKVQLTDKGDDTRKRDTENLAGFWSGVMEKLPPEKRTEFFEIYGELLDLAEQAGGR